MMGSWTHQNERISICFFSFLCSTNFRHLFFPSVVPSDDRKFQHCTYATTFFNRWHAIWLQILTAKDYGHPERAFFSKIRNFWDWADIWAEILWDIWGISGQTIRTILALWVTCSWKSPAGSLSYKKLWFLCLKHITPKFSQSKILAIKNLGNSVHISVFGGIFHWKIKKLNNPITKN